MLRQNVRKGIGSGGQEPASNRLKKEDFGSRGEAAVRTLTGLWTFLMLTVFPLYMRNHFVGMGENKFRFFLTVSAVCLIPAGVCRLYCFLEDQGRERWRTLCGNWSELDRAVLLYLAVVVVSWFMSVDRSQAWIGADGWFMGLRTQFLLVLLYFLVSRFFPWEKIIPAGHFLASGAVFLLGIGHRFGIDPLGMYDGIDESYQLLFLSTIGQASWYSSYVCTVLVIGVVGFFIARKPVCRLGLTVYCMIGFSTLVTQNSDSAFVALALLMLGLFVIACDSLDGMERFLETALLMLGSFKIVGILQQSFPDRATELGSISEFLSQSTETWLLFLAVCIVYAFFQLYRQKNPDRREAAHGRRLRKAALGAALAALLFYILVVWLNTTGRLEAQFGIKSTNGYLLFDRNWGNSRGFIWKFTLGAFDGLAWFRKLFGVGPDCYAVYCYGNPELSAALNHFFGWEQTLTNAHNEFLNTMFCMGIAGLITYGMIFLIAVQRFFRMRKKDPWVIAGMLAALSYGAHNFFCYQQICCTPFLFLILAMAENRLRRCS